MPNSNGRTTEKSIVEYWLDGQLPPSSHWLTDLDMYHALAHLDVKHQADDTQPGKANVFYPRPISHVQQILQQACKRTANSDQTTTIHIPANKGNNHWVHVQATLQNSQLQALNINDSLPTGEGDLSQYLNSNAMRSIPGGKDTRSTISCTIRQQDGSSCGYLTCHSIEQSINRQNSQNPKIENIKKNTHRNISQNSKVQIPKHSTSTPREDQQPERPEEFSMRVFMHVYQKALNENNGEQLASVEQFFGRMDNEELNRKLEAAVQELKQPNNGTRPFYQQHSLNNNDQHQQAAAPPPSEDAPAQA